MKNKVLLFFLIIMIGVTGIANASLNPDSPEKIDLIPSGMIEGVTCAGDCRVAIDGLVEKISIPKNVPDRFSDALRIERAVSCLGDGCYDTLIYYKANFDLPVVHDNKMLKKTAVFTPSKRKCSACGSWPQCKRRRYSRQRRGYRR